MVLSVPPFVRGVVKGSTNAWGRVTSSGDKELRPSHRGGNVPGLSPKLTQSVSATPSHLHALQKLTENTPFLQSGSETPLQAFSNRRLRLRQKADLKMQEDMFEDCRKFLMAGEKWTYGHMAAYQQKVLHLMGGYGWTRKLSGDDQHIKQLENELKVLEAMSPIELASNHKSVFTPEAIKLIAEKSGQEQKFVNNIILEHDILRADRRWYKILQQFGRQLPKSFEDRQFMAEYDRPFSETEAKMRQDMMDKHTEKAKLKKPPHIRCVYYRQPTCGGNRWSTRPPRSYPVRWKLRPDRRQRLAGVGVPGGGGDRGMPRGNLAKYWGPGGRPALRH